jgi:hypothetical protein
VARVSFSGLRLQLSFVFDKHVYPWLARITHSLCVHFFPSTRVAAQVTPFLIFSFSLEILSVHPVRLFMAAFPWRRFHGGLCVRPCLLSGGQILELLLVVLSLSTSELAAFKKGFEQVSSLVVASKLKW